MLEVKILVDPFEEFMKKQNEKHELDREREDLRREGKVDDERTTWTGKRIRRDGTVEDTGGGVGKYLKQTAADGGTVDDIVGREDSFEEPSRKKAKSTGGFGNFDGW
jgi:peptidyl-prolyl cis-trans isomerase-like 2